MSSTRFGKVPDPVFTKDCISPENSQIESRGDPFIGCLLQCYRNIHLLKTSNGFPY